MKILKKLYLMLIIIITLIAIGVLIYPSVSNYINNKYAVDTISQYKKKIEASSKKEINESLEKANKYNRCIATGLSSKSLFPDGYMFGYIEIPKIKVNLPIYEGTNKEILKKGVGVIGGTSIPVGGNNTHTVLAAHTGLTTQKMFTDIDKLKKGDLFFIHAFNINLAYEVNDITIVKPNDTSKLQIYPNEDCATLLTCYPYGINTERLLVTGKRVPYNPDKDNSSNTITNSLDSNLKISLKLKILLIIIILLVLFIFGVIFNNHRKNLKTKKLF